MKTRTRRALYAPELLESRIAPATFVVNSLADSGADSLRQAVLDANDPANPGADTITFGPDGVGVIVLASQIDITESVTIKGPGAAKAFVSGNDLTRIFQIDDNAAGTAQTVNISGLSLVHGSTAAAGAAISSAESLVLSKMAFTANSADSFGGAVSLLSTVNGPAPALIVKDSVFSGNATSGGRGGAIYAQTGAGVQITKTLFTHNTSDENGGAVCAQIIATGDGDIVITGATFRGNVAGSAGGGAFLDNERTGGLINVSKSLFVANHADGDGGGAAVEEGSATISGVTFQENESEARGGGLAGTTATTALTVTGGKFHANHAIDKGGGAFVNAGLTNDFTKAVFIRNVAGGIGGGFTAEGSAQVKLDGATFTENVGNTGGALGSLGSAILEVLKSKFIGNASTAGQGGSIFTGANSSLTLTDSSIMGGFSSADGGGIAVADNASLLLEKSIISGNVAGDDGGGVSFVGNSFGTLRNVKMLHNLAGGGGGGLYVSTATGSTTFVENSLIDGNAATGNGGGVSIDDGGLQFMDTTISNNRAAAGGGISVNSGASFSMFTGKLLKNTASREGGGIYSISDDGLSIFSALFLSNRAVGGDGGGIFHNGNSALSLSGITFEKNSSGGRGGGLFISPAALTADAVNFKSNTALLEGGGLFASSSSAIDLTNGTLFEKNRSLYADGGGAFLAGSGAKTVTDTIFKVNVSGHSGGALFHAAGTLKLQDVQVLKNIASFHGGGVATGSTAAFDVINGLFQSNVATFGDGGAFFLGGSGAKTITGTANVSKNKAGFEGGGIFLDAGTLTMATATITGNNAGFRGGGIRNDTGVAVVLGGSTVTGNTAFTDPNQSGL